MGRGGSTNGWGRQWGLRGRDVITSQLVVVFSFFAFFFNVRICFVGDLIHVVPGSFHVNGYGTVNLSILARLVLGLAIMTIGYVFQGFIFSCGLGGFMVLFFDHIFVGVRGHRGNSGRGNEGTWVRGRIFGVLLREKFSFVICCGVFALATGDSLLLFINTAHSTAPVPWARVAPFSSSVANVSSHVWNNVLFSMGDLLVSFMRPQFLEQVLSPSHLMHVIKLPVVLSRSVGSFSGGLLAFFVFSVLARGQRF